MRAIDGDALEELFREVIGGIAKKSEMNGNLEHMVRASAMVIEMIQDAPTIEPERKTGWWRHYERRLTCSECGIEYYDDIMEYCGDDVPRFCPNCGARMEDNNESD